MPLTNLQIHGQFDLPTSSRKTGSFRAYDSNPYPGYDLILQVWFPLVAESDELHIKEIILSAAENIKI